MSDEQMRMAIAETLGSLYHKPSEQEIKSGSYYQYEPNYVNDLNATRQVIWDHIVGNHELEKRFIKELNSILDRMADDDTVCICEYEMAQITATARQLNEAFLRTVGKWKEDA